jgi:chromosomal replication initiator protein
MQVSAETIWEAAQKSLRAMLNTDIYNLWFLPIKAVALDQEVLTLEVADEFCEIWLKDNYSELIHDVLMQDSTQKLMVRFRVNPAGASLHSVAAGEGSTKPAPESAERNLAAVVHEIAFNLENTFESFVVGENNNHAHAAAMAVASAPGRSYNPLFLYGGVGMGKTHLMQAIGHEVKRRQPQAAICYISSEKFTNEMINSLRYDKMSSFRDKFRNVDVLLVDDIQFLAQKERTQEEFFHTFNALHESMKQIVIASDRPPKELAEIEDRLRSRFEWGLIADIQPPDLETKVAILQKKAEQEKVTLPTDVALYVASNIRSNVRELEGALIRLVAHSSLIGAEITLPYAQQVLKNFIDSQARKVTIEAIQKAVAEQFGLRLVEIKAKNNSRAIVYPRQIAMYLAKHLTEASLPEIGRQFGGKHHTTVLHSVEKIDELRTTDKDLNRLLNKMTEQLGG